ncbi:PadR family transcriptional regulator [Streptomyces reniochalinae]|uniref:PadR family transcriptional regulator n=1 Tax=Streptomyces reniochalinae TaxID=2250578 RepID=A0A367E7Q8_9ACTN|nr:PadR family transcriptional regulator [Streptomyces reniochalinae]RCG13437.1 PadR family transcriptional regulator [Streptomyces reniochalinae]
MPPVFAHGRLRLYLLMLLAEAPRHGYEVIRLLEERFQGLYAPSAGTVYPRLAKLEAEGLVSHTTEGGRKVYAITEAGRTELDGRQAELAELEIEIRDSVAALAGDIREDVSGTAGDLRREMREQARTTRHRSKQARAPKDPTSGWEKPAGWDDGWGEGWEGVWGDKEAWRHAKEEMRRAKDEWKEQARKAKEEAQRAKRQARKEREAHTEALAEVHRLAHQVQDQVQSRVQAGDWSGAVRDGMSELARGMGSLGRMTGASTPWPPYVRPHPAGTDPDAEAEAPMADSTGDPARDLERLLDRFRDDVRDAARDHGVDEGQLREVRRHLSTAAAHIGVLLRGAEAGADGATARTTTTTNATDAARGAASGAEGNTGCPGT